MKKTIINGVEFCNFGSNNYSCGMELITCYPMVGNMIQDVLDGKYPGVFLNPSAPCTTEFYGVLGTREQYDQLYNKQVKAQIAKKTINILGGFEAMQKASLEEFNVAEEEATANYRDWWDAEEEC